MEAVGAAEIEKAKLLIELAAAKERERAAVEACRVVMDHVFIKPLGTGLAWCKYCSCCFTDALRIKHTDDCIIPQVQRAAFPEVKP